MPFVPSLNMSVPLSPFLCDLLCQCQYMLSDSSPRVFPIIWSRRNGYEYHSSTLSCPVRPPPLTHTFSVTFLFLCLRSFGLFFVLNPVHLIQLLTILPTMQALWCVRVVSYVPCIRLPTRKQRSRDVTIHNSYSQLMNS